MRVSEVDKNFIKKLFHEHTNISMGGDPEFFISNSKGKILNADAFLPGKDKPLMVKANDGRESKLFFDGIQAEMAVSFNVCREYLIDNIKRCWKELLDHIPKGHKIVLKPSAKIQKSIIEKADPEARIFGCAPDFNAYTLSTNTPEMDASSHPFRYAGGHLHFGVPCLDIMKEKDGLFKVAATEQGHLRIVKLLDLLVTIPTLLLDNGPGSIRRRSKYGKAGCFRPTPYGVEYRTPSCWWLKSPMTVSIVYGLGRLAWTIARLNLDKEFFDLIKTDEETISGCINESDVEIVKKIWKNMRPYIALMGKSISNPLHIGSAKSTHSFYLHDRYRGFAGPPKILGKPVFSLAAFEYMLKHGIDSVISGNISDEWAIFEKESMFCGNGFLTGSFDKLVNNKDFERFQTSFLKELYA
jgi:hypothetical protein